MKAIITRIRRMEQRFVPTEDTESQGLAHVIRERRRRRCEANGEPFEELGPPAMRITPGKRLSIAETLRMRRLRAYEQNPQATGVAAQNSCR